MRYAWTLSITVYGDNDAEALDKAADSLDKLSQMGFRAMAEEGELEELGPENDPDTMAE